MTKFAITFSCDTNYFPLLKGLILSLASVGIPDGDTTLYLADAGCSTDELAWLADRQVRAVKFSCEEHYSFPKEIGSNQRYAPLLYRGVIPTLFPGHEIYLHIDADIWIQRRAGVMTYLEVCEQNPGKVVISPCVDASYMSEYRREQSNVNGLYRTYLSVYDKDTALAYFARPTLSAGIFAAHRDHRIWNEWRQHMEMSYAKSYDVASDGSGSDQTTLNCLLQRDLDFIPLQAKYNYNCHVGLALRKGVQEQVMVGIPPFEVIDVVHLVCFGTYKEMYYKYGLLYDQGRYLTDQDFHTLGLRTP